MDEVQASQLSALGWAVEQIRECDEYLSLLREIHGTYETERMPSYSYIEGYRNGISMLLRKQDQEGPKK